MVIDSQQQRYKDVVAELQNLTQLYTSPKNENGELVTLEEYEPQRKALLIEKQTLDEAQQDTSRKIEEWIDWAENSFHFATAAQLWFAHGTPEQKRSIFCSLSGSNLTLHNRNLHISLQKPLDCYARIAQEFPTTTMAIEPVKKPIDKRKYLPFEADIPRLRGHKDSNPDSWFWRPMFCH